MEMWNISILIKQIVDVFGFQSFLDCVSKRFSVNSGYKIFKELYIIYTRPQKAGKVENLSGNQLQGRLYSMIYTKDLILIYGKELKNDRKTHAWVVRAVSSYKSLKHSSTMRQPFGHN